MAFKNKPHHIIAIGASAGGMEEINSFFDHTPMDGVSYIIIQHLSADFKSRMVELLSKHSKLKVEEAKNGLVVNCNQVYLIPHDKLMTIRKGVLYLTEKDTAKAPHLTINEFFSSLAADCGTTAIAVIFSGLGADGSEGIKAIKKAGGMVMARKPETSGFPSMPTKAIATGLVDFILEPAEMPVAIENYVKMEGKLAVEIKGDEESLNAIIELIKEKSPMDFTEYKPATLLRRTKRRAAFHNFSTLGAYLRFLKKAPEELELLSKEFLVSVTSFFRDAGAFEFIQKNIFSQLLEKLTPGDELKMWVAGCATGEEVYSLAILISELLVGDYRDTVVKIFATDLDAAALVHAGKAVYRPNTIKGISEQRLKHYFVKESDNYKVNPVIRKMVIFAQHDLVKNPPYCNMHFISCRNLLIYMTPVLQKKIFNMLLFGLKKDGYLFLGSSENPMPIIKNLLVVNKQWKVYKNLKTKKVVSFDAFSMPELQNIKRIGAYSNEYVKISTDALAEAMHENLAEESDYLAVCIDENNTVLKSYGETGKFLLAKHFTSNLEELLPKSMAIAFNTLGKKVKKINEKATVYGVSLKQGNMVINVSISISPLPIRKKDHKLYMVIFSENKQATGIQKNTIEFDEKLYHNEYTQNLEEEVKDLKDKLNSAYEQLDASNENMQSFNEEMVSANEEMQSTNEEMQSVNEELDTINTEYQLKNKELLEMNDDLNNYFRSNINGQLFINNEMVLMKFSPGTVKQINLLDSDIGRPLSNITTNIKFETILNDIQQVLTEGTVITKEIETNNGKWYQIMTMPYVQQSENKNNGAIITFNDITELKKAQLDLDKRNKSLQRINVDLDHFIHAASHDLLAPLGNIETSINVMNKIPLTDKKLMDFLNIINQSVKKFRELITDIGTIAKVEGDMIKLEKVDLVDIIHNIEWSLESKILASGAIINQMLEVKQLFFSKKNLRSIIYNLISNAIKFKDGKAPIINIYSKREGDQVIFSVQDNGRGISKDGMEKIFDMYGRLNQDVEGHGIGLYLAKKIINAAGGQIVVASEPGKGSKFSIYLKSEQEL